MRTGRGLRSTQFRQATDHTGDDAVQLPLAAASKPKRASTKATAVPMANSRMARPRATAVFDTYWKFAAERQKIFHLRAAGAPLTCLH